MYKEVVKVLVQPLQQCGLSAADRQLELAKELLHVGHSEASLINT